MKALNLVLPLTLVCLVAGVALSIVNGVTEGRIKEQKKRAELKAVREVLPPLDNDPVKDRKIIVIEKDQRKVFYPGKKGNMIVGVAFSVQGEGYGGSMKIMMGVNPRGELTGISILEHSETPGLGSLVEEEKLRQQFKDKSLSNSKLAVNKDGGDINAITGATISSRGVTEAVAKGLEIFEKSKDEILKR